jgi:hypothetical protein
MLNSLAFSLMAFTAVAEGPGEGALMSAPFELRYASLTPVRQIAQHQLDLIRTILANQLLFFEETAEFPTPPRLTSYRQSGSSHAVSGASVVSVALRAAEMAEEEMDEAAE